MVSLYSADISDIAQPVKKEKKIRAKKNVPKIDDTPAASPIATTEIEPVPVPLKKAATEKQLAALAKAQETRKRKRDEKLAQEAAAVEAQKQEDEKRLAIEEAQLQKKAAANERRKLARLAKKNTPPPSEASDTTSNAIDVAVAELKPKKQVRPPAWFKQFVNNVKQEEAEAAPIKRAKTTVTKEINKIANEKWQDGHVRDQVQDETSRHQQNMYAMIFGKR